MSPDQRTTVSRRRILQTSALAAIGAGLAGSPAITQAEPTSFLAAPDGHDEAFTAWLEEYQQAYGEALDAKEALRDEIMALLPLPRDEAWRLIDRFDIAKTELSDLEEARTVELMARHLPGLAWALRLVYQHTIESHATAALDCCQGVTL